MSPIGNYRTNLTEYEQQKLEATASENDEAEAEPETDISEYCSSASTTSRPITEFEIFIMIHLIIMIQLVIIIYP